MVLPQLRLRGICFGVLQLKGQYLAAGKLLPLVQIMAVEYPAVSGTLLKQTQNDLCPASAERSEAHQSGTGGRSLIVVLHTGLAKLKYATALGLHVFS